MAGKVILVGGRAAGRRDWLRDGGGAAVRGVGLAGLPTLMLFVDPCVTDLACGCWSKSTELRVMLR